MSQDQPPEGRGGQPSLLPDIRANRSRQARELNDYLRSIGSSVISWFTVFVTINYASMGWLAGAKDRPPALASIVAWLFMSQNLLALICAFVLDAYFSKVLTTVAALETSIGGALADAATTKAFVNSLPAHAWTQTFSLMKLTFLVIGVTWYLLERQF